MRLQILVNIRDYFTHLADILLGDSTCSSNNNVIQSGEDVIEIEKTTVYKQG